ncbi:MAG: acyl-CoA desaturase [Alcanivoracaceae bacterium]|nr:acyl-CoA desaturase [Alcanivoracaceae bacterium]
MNAAVETHAVKLKPVSKAGKLPVNMTDEQLQAFGQEIEAIRERIMNSLGEKDARYIRRMIKTQRWMEIGGRGLLFAGILPPAWLAGTAMLGVAKILENMEIGHNVIHGQWDWMRDPDIHSSTWDWDNVCPADHWKHSHNHMHHKWTNVVGMDRDVGYGILRMSEKQEWEPYYLGQPIYNFLLATFFEWGVALHDLEAEKIRHGEKSYKDAVPFLKEVWTKVRKQVTKDYILFPAMAGPFFLPVLTGNAVANIIRNYWAYAIIFCGHFPEGTEDFDMDVVENEDKAHWYLRQMLGSANIEGGKLMHIMSGNLSHQIEHHLFPDMPSNRYAEAAREVRAICRKYGLPYNSNSLRKQFTSSMKKVLRLSLPNRRKDGDTVTA